MSDPRAPRSPPEALAEAWWPLQDVAPTGSPRHADHVTSGWWDPGDPHRTRLRHAAALVDELLASLPADAVAAGSRVLELGCGPGSSASELIARRGCELHAWDASQSARDIARVLAPEAVVHESAAPPLAVVDASVDLVWAPRCFARGGVDWSELLAEAHRVLRPGGWLAAVLAGPGAWAWEEREEPWDEERTGILVLGLDRRDDEGGSICFTSRWWRREHWGRGFDAVGLRPAGVTMTHPGQGFGLGVWQRRDGAPVPAARFAAIAPGDLREGRALRRQLELADADARAATTRRTATLAEVERRSAALARPDSVEDHPRVRDAVAAVAALEAEVQRLRASASRSPAAPLRAIGARLRAGRGSGS